MSSTFSLLFASRLDVRDVVASRQRALEVFRVVSFIRTHVLWASRSWLRTVYKNAAQSWQSQSEVVSIGRTDRDSQHNSANVGEQRAFGAQLTPISRIWAGFFPLQAVPWSSRCQAFAIANRFLVACHIQPILASTTCGTRYIRTTLENSDANCFQNRIGTEPLSTGSQFASRSRYRWRPFVRPRAVGHPSGCGDGEESTCGYVATMHPAYEYTNLR